MNTLWIRNARHWRTNEPIEVAIEDGVIGQVSASLGESRNSVGDVIDAGGAILSPGLVDLHVHLREPGQSGKETIASGTRAAAAGGFTAVACMPNTDPVLDSVAWIEWVLARVQEAGHCRVHPIAAVTVGQRGEQMAELAALAGAGAVAFSDDGRPIMSAAMMRRALEYARDLGRPIVCHEEDLTLRGDGHMNEGAVATRLGIAGIPTEAESVMVWRDCELVERTGGHAHFAHLSCVRSLAAVREAKRRGLQVTAETCPHYWTLTDDAVGRWDTNAKMNPPLRSEADRQAVIDAIADGTVDCLATDHAPHRAIEKDAPFDQAPFGIVGLETALGLTISNLVAPGHISMARALELWTEAPRRVFGLPPVALAPGHPADLVLIRPDEEWTVHPERFHTLGRNTPFRDARLKGVVLATVCGGRVTHAHESLAGSRTSSDLAEARR